MTTPIKNFQLAFSGFNFLFHGIAANVSWRNPNVITSLKTAEITLKSSFNQLTPTSTLTPETIDTLEYALDAFYNLTAMLEEVMPTNPNNGSLPQNDPNPSQFISNITQALAYFPSTISGITNLQSALIAIQGITSCSSDHQNGTLSCTQILKKVGDSLATAVCYLSNMNC